MRLVILIFIAITSHGCNAYVIHKGELTIIGINLGLDRGVQRMELDGIGSMIGFETAVSVDAAKAFGESVGTGVGIPRVKP